MTPNLNLSLWLIPTLPLAGAAINGFLGKKSSRTAVSTVGLFFSGAAFAWALVAVLRGYESLPYIEYVAHWIRSGTFTVDFAFYLVVPSPSTPEDCETQPFASGFQVSLA